MKRYGLRQLLPLLLALAVSTSCASAPYQTVPMPSDLGEMPSMEVARIYVARSTQFWGKVHVVDVIDRGVDIGSIDENTFLCWDRKPDQTPIELYYHGPSLTDGVIEGQLAFDGEPGCVYYYAVHLRRSDRKPEVRLLNVKEGQALIADRAPAQVR
jgi:hypothetical protein